MVQRFEGPYSSFYALGSLEADEEFARSVDLHGPRDGQSLVWLFFKDVDEQKYGKLYGDCNVCGARISRGRQDTQTTESPRKHLRTTHPKSLVKLNEADALNGNFGMSSIIVIQR